MLNLLLQCNVFDGITNLLLLLYLFYSTVSIAGVLLIKAWFAPDMTDN